MRRWKLALAGAIVAAASFNALACYTVYDRAGRVAYNGSDAPVDMSLPLHETMPQRFPGGHLVFDTTTDCPSVNLAARGFRRDLSPLASPLLTDEVTAERMHVPHTRVASGIALIPAQQVAMAPAVTVIPSEATLSAAARSPSRDTTVITELRDGSVVDTRVLGGPPARKMK